DCSVARSSNADTASTWTNGFGAAGLGFSPPNNTAVIDKTMIFQCKQLSFAPLASDVMLAVYNDGAVAQPDITNLRYKRSGLAPNAGRWTNVAAGGGDGTVFPTSIQINQNDWALVPLSTSKIFAFRRNNANGTSVAGASYGAATNTW